MYMHIWGYLNKEKYYLRIFNGSTNVFVIFCRYDVILYTLRYKQIIKFVKINKQFMVDEQAKFKMCLSY